MLPMTASGAAAGIGLHHPIGSVYFNGVLCDVGSSSSSSSTACSLYMSPHEWCGNGVDMGENQLAAATSNSSFYSYSSAAASVSAASSFNTAGNCASAPPEPPLLNAGANHASERAEDDAAAVGVMKISSEQQVLESSVLIPLCCSAANALEAAGASPLTEAPPSPSNQRISPHHDLHVGRNAAHQECGSGSKRVVDGVAVAHRGDTHSSAVLSSDPSPKRPRGSALDFSTAKMLL